MRVVFVSDHFSTPDQPGILRTWELARHLCDAGDDVTVIAPERHYLFSAAGRCTPLPEGLHLVSIPSPGLDRSRLSSRLRYYLGQLLRATWEVWRSGPCDVVVAGQTPSVLSIGPYLVARARRVPFVLDERDLALDAAAELRLLPRPVIAGAQWLERLLHRRADQVLAVTPGLQRVLEERGVHPTRLRLVPNGLDPLPDAPPRNRERLRSELGWDDKVVLLYAGGLGHAYDLHVVLEAMAKLQAEHLLLAVLGDGERKDVYRRRAETQELAVQFLQPRPKNEVRAFCDAADIGVLPLQPIPRSSYVLSNKLFDYLGSGKPVVATGVGDTAELLSEAGAGIVVPAGDSQAMAAALKTLAADPRLRAEMGESGRSFVNAHWRRQKFAHRFRESLVQAVNGAGACSLHADDREPDRIERIYHRYDVDPREQSKRCLSNRGVRVIAEHRAQALRALLDGLPRVDNPNVLDLGCGDGSDLRRIADLWADRHPALYGVDLLADRIERARAQVPNAELLVGNARRLPFPDGHFQVVLVSTVFSSILDESLSRAVAGEILRVLAPGGVVILYDVRLPNPLNRNVRPVSRRRLVRLFPGTQVVARSLTVLPPLVRRLGIAARPAAAALHRLPFLRSHNLATITRHGGRVLFVAHAEHRFPNMTVNQRLKALVRHGRVDVLTCYPRSFPLDVASQVRIIAAPLSSRIPYRIPKALAFTLEACVWALLRARSRGYELVYSFQDSSALVGWLLRDDGTRWVMDAVDDPAMELSNARERGKRFKSLLLTARDKALGALLRRADLVCTIGSDHGAPLPKMLLQSYGVEPARVVPLNQAIDVDAVSAVRYRHAPLLEKPMVMFVGFVSPLRGVDTLLEAGRIVRSNGVDLEVQLIGHLQPQDEPWLAAFMHANPGLVRYRGVLHSEATLEAMAEATLGVLPFPDRREMQPVQAITGLEYLALGKPLVGSRLPGLASLIEDGVNGFLVTPGSADELALAMAKILESPELARAMSDAARAHVRAFDVNRVNPRLESALSAWA